MEKPFKETWLYILVPILILLGVVLYLVLSGNGSGPTDFDGYPL